MARWLFFGLAGILIFLGLLGFLAYQFLVRPAQALVQDFQQIITLDRQIPSQNFTPPAQLSQQQLQRFLQVQQEVRDGLGARFSAVSQRFEQLSNQLQGQAMLDYRALLDLFRDSGQLVVDAKELQVQAVIEQNFSLQEYTWVKGQVYAALGLGLPTLDPQEILRQIGAGDFNTQVELLTQQVPQSTQRLVEAFRQELELYYPLTWFGL